MYKRIILMILVIGFLSCNPASAVNLVVNGGFETGDLSGWSYFDQYAPASDFIVGAEYANNSNYGVKGEALAGWSYIYQTIDLTNVDNISFDYRIITIDTPAYQSGFFIDDVSYKAFDSPISYSTCVIDVSGLSGNRTIKFMVDDYNDALFYLDNIVADDETAGPTDYIVWSTWPEDSWAVGNYSMIVVGLPRPPDPVNFYIKTPSTDYIKKPLTKSPLVKTWNYEESQWYYQYFHTVYHSQYGDYSCKIVNSSADFIEYSNITVPYSSPDVPIPPVVTIPTPDPIETPPEWNVTIPEQYENVSWIFDYTDFWDDFGTTLNDTLYSTVGLIFIPMESINESVYTVYTHVDTAADMVSGSEHTNVIVQVAWNVIPDSIKTIFIGAAAIGLCIFILHRRT